MTKTKTNLRKAILAVLGVSAMAGLSSQAAAMNAISIGVLNAGDSYTQDNAAPKRAWADYGTNLNYGWTHTAKFYTFQVGSLADIAAGNRFNVSVDVKAGTTGTPMNTPGFSIWTSGANPIQAPSANGAGYGHQWSQVRGPNDGGVGGDPCGVGGDCALGTNGWMNNANSGGNIVSGRDGWIGYANAGYSFTNGDGDKIQGRLAGATNAANVGQYQDGSALTNVNSASPYVNGGFATLVAGDAFLNLQGLKAGYYLMGLAGSCPDNNSNGQNCQLAGGQTYKMSMAVTAVPVPAAVWLFGSAMAGIAAMGRRKRTVI